MSGSLGDSPHRAHPATGGPAAGELPARHSPPPGNPASDGRPDQIRRAVDDLLDSVSRYLAQSPLPRATYRLQFNSRFTFRDAAMLVPYLETLGISHVYASPYLRAQAGSAHGYDIVDHTALNPELGTAEDYEAFVAALRAHGMGHILDVVPNHMGVGSDDNAWWLDVLENGPSSPYAAFFDIDWMPLKPDLAHKVLLPVLGDQFGKVLEDQQLVLKFEEGAFWVHYHERRFPIAPRSLTAILRHRLEQLEHALGSENPHFLEYQSILTAISHLPPRTETDPEKINERRREKEVIKRRLTELCRAAPQVDAFIADNVRIFNGTPGDPRSFDLLDQLLQDQAYRLAHWRVAADEINYRRFFDVNELAAICTENPDVFQKTHALIFRLIDERKLDGLRIDHTDGLYDPTDYLCRLQRTRFLQLCRAAWTARAASQGAAVQTAEAAARCRPAAITAGNAGTEPDAAGPAPPEPAWEDVEPALLERFEQACRQNPHPLLARPLYVVVEKILERGERLPQSWPVHGTTGYEFLNSAGGLLVDRAGAKAFDSIYSRFIRQRLDFKELAYDSKKLIMQASMSSEVAVLGHQLDRISERNRSSRDFTLNSLTDALREIIACFPVYRTYLSDEGVLERDRRYIEAAVARAKRKNPATSASVFDFVRDVLLLRYPENADDATRALQRRFVGRFQQMTGPVMAKGVEDTAFYRFNRLVSLNDVGGDPEKFGGTLGAFHQQFQEHLAHWPLGLLATTTHDSKRSEDVRARINVLSEMPREWQARLARWSRLNQRKKTILDGELAPTRNDEYLLYQTLIGTWPIDTPTPLQAACADVVTTGSHASLSHHPPHAPYPANRVSSTPGAPPKNRNAAGLTYTDRIKQYMIKAAREAKLQTSWVSPNERYEQALAGFIDALLAEQPRNAFLADLASFAGRVAAFGIWNSLSQTLLKLTCPGVPDIYQGTELWTLSLVDPDNRRPVDYALPVALLHSIEERTRSAAANLPAFVRELVQQASDGRIKLYVIWRALQQRKLRPQVFTTGAYVPLGAVGEKKEHLCAFARRDGQQALVVVVPRLVVALTGGAAVPPLGEVWGDTHLPLPDDFSHAAARNLLTGETHAIRAGELGGGIRLADLLRHFPVALLELS